MRSPRTPRANVPRYPGSTSRGCVTREYELVDLPDPPRPFPHDLRLELAVPVPRHRDRDPPVGRGHRFRRRPGTGITGSGAGRVITTVAEMVGHLSLQSTPQDGLGHLVEQSVDPSDRGTGGLRVSEQRVDRRRGKSIGEPASRSGLDRLGVVLWHVGVLPDRHVDHNGRSWSTRGLHTCRDTPPATAPAGQARQGELFAAYRYHAVFTDNAEAMLAAEATHRAHAIVEQVIAELKNGPLAHLPSGVFTANAAWLTCAAIAHNLTRAAGVLAGGRHTRARTATLRAQLIITPARVAHSAHHQTLHLPRDWPWEPELDELLRQALHDPVPTAA